MRLPIATAALATALLLGASAHGEQRRAVHLSIETAEPADLVLPVASSAVAPHTEARPAGDAAMAVHAADADVAASSGISALLSGIADQLMGIRYQFGGNTESGVDCSGLVRLVWDKLGLGLATLPRSAASMATLGLPVSLRDIEPGDLVFFNTLGRSFSHVGVYLGEGRFLHASSGQRRVTLSSLSERYFRERFEGARRLLKQ